VDALLFGGTARRYGCWLGAMVAFATRWVDGSYVPPAACTCIRIIHHLCMHYLSPPAFASVLCPLSSVVVYVVVLCCLVFPPRCLAADCLVYVNRCPKSGPCCRGDVPANPLPFHTSGMGSGCGPSGHCATPSVAHDSCQGTFCPLPPYRQTPYFPTGGPLLGSPRALWALCCCPRACLARGRPCGTPYRCTSHRYVVPHRALAGFLLPAVLLSPLAPTAVPQCWSQRSLSPAEGRVPPRAHAAACSSSVPLRDRNWLFSQFRSKGTELLLASAKDLPFAR
jgi:hypothetical protein